MKKQVYLDSTIFSYLFDHRDDIKNFIDITKQWWREEKGYFDLWISEETLFGLNKSNYPNQDKVLTCALQVTLLPVADEIKKNCTNLFR